MSSGATSTPSTSVATLPVVRSLFDDFLRKGHPSGVLGIRARPEWSGPESFAHLGVPVTVVTCGSTLAVREALLSRAEGTWLVIITDRDDNDLGAGVRSHLLGHRLKTPDPWDAVQGRFAATGLDRALTNGSEHRALASGLLACAPVDAPWPPAPGGVLTRDHALAAVTAARLRLSASALTPNGVLSWTAETTSTSAVADLRALAGGGLTDAVLDWIAGHLGAAAPLLRPLLRDGQGRRAVPLGLVLAALLAARAGVDDVPAQVALGRLEVYTGRATPPGALLALAVEAEQLVQDLLRETQRAPLAKKLLAEADVLLAEVGAVALAGVSPLLPAGLTARLHALAAVLQQQAAPPVLESAWSLVEGHALAAHDDRVIAFGAAIRLTRWLAADPVASGQDLTALHLRYVEQDAWVDSAVNDAAPGVGDAALGAALSSVLARVQVRRDSHDVQFAAALAAATRDDAPVGDGVVLVEDLLAQQILPLARRTPVLLLVLDGMSAAVGGEIVDSLVGKADGWAEALPAGRTRRIGAVTALPSITHVSRASLLSGELRTGGQDVEQRGYADLTRAHGLAAAKLFHKKPLDSSQPGFAVAGDVGAAIDDKTGHRLVTCVLNTIDDALDRSDPAGTVWTAETIKHLGPLLDRARIAGRLVVLTSDHGHIVERRLGSQRSAEVISSARSRAEGPVGDGEVLVIGRRVLEHNGRAVLAVSERLRYGPLKAGYHGGAAPAEVVIPVYFLVSGGQLEGTDLVLAPLPQPLWWFGPLQPVVAPIAAKTPVAAPTLFDPIEVVPVLQSPLAAATLASVTYQEQRAMAGRVSVSDEQIGDLLVALLAAPAHRLPPMAAAVALTIPLASLRGAFAQAQRLLNVEGFAVLKVDVDGATVVLDEALLREQFELRA